MFYIDTEAHICELLEVSGSHKIRDNGRNKTRKAETHVGNNEKHF